MIDSRLLIGPLLILPLANAYPADWQSYGNTMAQKEEVASFFDADSIEHPDKDTVRVWARAISQEALNRYREKHASEKQYINDVAQRIASGNTPAYLELPSIKKQYPNSQGTTLQDAIHEVTVEDYIANTAEIPTKAKFFFEIDCKGKRIGPLSVTLYGEDGEVSHTDNAVSVKYLDIPPDTSGEWLSLLVCPKP